MPSSDLVSGRDAGLHRDHIKPQQARCPLVGCDGFLGVLISRSGLVFEDGTIDPDITSTWSVGCDSGHVVLLPPDTAKDYYEWDEAASAMVRDLLGSVA